jgi:3',5'-cyclic AMP phosphodiesterase CpdA
VRLVLTSDLHVDHHPEVVPIVRERLLEISSLDGRPVDVLVVAGDVSASPEHLEQALRGLRSGAARAVYVPGNHDLWSLAGGPSSRARYEQVLPAKARAAGFDPLGRDPVEIGGVWFAGVTGWYDFSLRNRALDETFSLDDYRTGAWGRLRWNDVMKVVWPDDRGALLDAPAICAAQVRALEEQLALVAGRPSVVVTHHLPFAELVTSKGELPWDFLNGFMGSAKLGELILRTPGVLLSLSGHTHFRKSARLRGASGPVRAEVSPIGYPREYRRAGLDLAERVRERVTVIDLPEPEVA